MPLRSGARREGLRRGEEILLEESGCEILREWPGSKALYFRDPVGQIVRRKN